MEKNFRIKKKFFETTRERYRSKIITLFLKEEHGSINNVNYYYYTVEKLSDGNEIFLKRPTSLNKGFDFEVRVSNVQFRYGKRGNIISTGNRPSHKDILKDLQLKKNESAQLYKDLFGLITKIYKCENVTLAEMQKINLTKGHSIEIILNVLKWLFIEQDITYWNRSGREMLYQEICKI